MSKIAFIFPGQGAQYVGMAEEFYEAIPECREVFEKAQKSLDFDVIKCCFEENEEIHQTEYTQAVMLTACLSILRAVTKYGVKPDVTAGLSLGEYAALVASGVFTEEDAIQLVRKRGIYMASEVPSGKGGMAAVLGANAETVEKVCKQVTKALGKVVEPANYNCPGQIVISGEVEALQTAMQELKEAGAKRVVPLSVSGPFHCSLLQGAGEKLKHELDHVTCHALQIPYTSNVTGTLITNKEDIIPLLVQQVSTSVRWQQCVEAMIAEGVTTFIEIGPGKTLSGFMRKIDRTVEVLNIETVEDLKKLEKVSCNAMQTQ